MGSEESDIEKSIKQRGNAVFLLDTLNSNPFLSEGFYEQFAKLLIEVCDMKHSSESARFYLLSSLLQRFVENSLKKRSNGEVSNEKVLNEEWDYDELTQQVLLRAQACGLDDDERRTHLMLMLYRLDRGGGDVTRPATKRSSQC